MPATAEAKPSKPAKKNPKSEPTPSPSIHVGNPHPDNRPFPVVSQNVLMFGLDRRPATGVSATITKVYPNGCADLLDTIYRQLYERCPWVGDSGAASAPQAWDTQENERAYRIKFESDAAKARDERDRISIARKAEEAALREQEKDKVLEMYDSGKAPPEIARAFGRHWSPERVQTLIRQERPHTGPV